MTPNQQKLYWREWGACRRALRKLGRSPAEADAMRKEIHVLAGAAKYGRPKSSAWLNNADLDKVLAIFRSYSDPANLAAQIRYVDQPSTRALYAAKLLLDRIGIQEHGREAYLDGIARRACRRPLIDTTDHDLPTILAALTHTWYHRVKQPHSHHGLSERVGSHSSRPDSISRRSTSVPDLAEVDDGNPF